MSILKIGNSSRDLFDLKDSHKIFKEKGIEEYAKYQRKNEDNALKKGVAFALVEPNRVGGARAAGICH